MKKLLLILLFFPIIGVGQVIDCSTRFIKIFNDFTSHYVQETSDSGYIIAGYVPSSSNNIQAAILKTDKCGDELWRQTFPSFNNNMVNSVQQTGDGGYIACGSSNSTSQYASLYKTDSLGNIQWSQIYTTTQYSDDVAYCVQQTTDGGFIMTGQRKPYYPPLKSVSLAKIDILGNQQWYKTYGDNCFGTSLQQTNDGGYIIAGKQATSQYAYIIKTNNYGDTIWTKKIFGTSWAEAHSIQQTNDGGYIFSGVQDGDILVVKLDSLSNIDWTHLYTFCNVGNINNSALHIQQTDDGGYIITGNCGDNLLLRKFDVSGNTIWSNYYPDFFWTPNNITPLGGECIQQTDDGGYIISGGRLLMKVDSLGNNCLTTSTLDTISCDSYNWSIYSNSAGWWNQNYITDGVYTHSYNNNWSHNYCLSIDTLVLNINYSNTTTDTAITCDTYNWNGTTYSQSGIFSNTFTNSNGCDSMITLDLTITGYPSLTIIQNGINLEATSSINYYWNTGDSSQIITPTTNGTYWCVITDNYGCESDTAFFEVTNIVSSINESITNEKEVLKINNILGQPTTKKKNTPLFYIYDDGTVEKKIIIE